MDFHIFGKKVALLHTGLYPWIPLGAVIMSDLFIPKRWHTSKLFKCVLFLTEICTLRCIYIYLFSMFPIFIPANTI